MKETILKEKSFVFATRVVKLYQYLCENKKDCFLSEQLLQYGTSVGAFVRRAEFAEDKKDFMREMTIAQNNINQTMYWLDLLKHTDTLTLDIYEDINTDAEEILKMISSLLQTP